MSCTLTVYALDLQRLRTVFGCADAAWLAEVLERHRGHLAEHDDYFQGQAGPAGYTPLAEALSQIVAGRIDPDLQPRFQFEHAMALVAAELGQRLDASALSECKSTLFNETDNVILHSLQAAGRPSTDWPLLAQVLQRGPGLNLPVDTVWPLGSGSLEAGEVRQALAAAQACDLAAASDALQDAADALTWPDEALDAAEQYRQWLSQAAALRLGLYMHL